MVALARPCALRAVVRVIFCVALEACSTLLARTWRGDAGSWAVITLSRLVHADFLLRARRLVGLVAALRRSLQLVGVTVLDDHEGWRAGDGSFLARPLEAAWSVCDAFLHTAWRVAEWMRLASRRRDMQHVAAADDETTQRSLWRARLADQAAALLNVVLGGAVPQDVAASVTLYVAAPALGRLAQARWGALGTSGRMSRGRGRDWGVAPAGGALCCQAGLVERSASAGGGCGRSGGLHRR